MGYVEIADAPGRGWPGSGSIDWPGFFAVLGEFGYDGPAGLEVFPSDSESSGSADYIRSLLVTE